MPKKQKIVNILTDIKQISNAIHSTDSKKTYLNDSIDSLRNKQNIIVLALTGFLAFWVYLCMRINTMYYKSKSLWIISISLILLFAIVRAYKHQKIRRNYELQQNKSQLLASLKSNLNALERILDPELYDKLNEAIAKEKMEKICQNPNNELYMINEKCILNIHALIQKYKEIPIYEEYQRKYNEYRTKIENIDNK